MVLSHAPKSRRAAKSCPAGRTYWIGRFRLTASRRR